MCHLSNSHYMHSEYISRETSKVAYLNITYSAIEQWARNVPLFNYDLQKKVESAVDKIWLTIIHLFAEPELMTRFFSDRGHCWAEFYTTCISNRIRVMGRIHIVLPAYCPTIWTQRLTIKFLTVLTDWDKASNLWNICFSNSAFTHWTTSRSLTQLLSVF